MWEQNLPESKNQNRVDNNLKEFAKNNLNFDDITYPVKIGNDMNKVCDMNHITIFVFSYNGKNHKENHLKKFSGSNEAISQEEF